MLRGRGLKVILYLDDFITVSSSFTDTVTAQNTLIQLLEDLGFAVKFEKVVPPATRVKFLGLILHSVLECIELPLDKLSSLKQMASNYSSRTKVTKKTCRFLLATCHSLQKRSMAREPPRELLLIYCNNLNVRLITSASPGSFVRN